MLEPFVFIAILALYIEFPAIQDLIYTKICLEVLAKQGINFIPKDNPNAVIANTSDPNHGFTTLPTNGRIQELNVSLKNATSITSISGLLGPRLMDSLSLCNRVNKTDVPDQVRQEILDIDSVFWLKYQLIIGLLSMLASPYWGGLSDKIGRLIPLNIPISASLLCNLISLAFGVVISLNIHEHLDVNWLFSGALLVGLSGGQAVLISNAFSYLSDNTSSEERSKRVTILESTIFLAHSFGFYLSKLTMSLELKGPIWLNKHFVAFSACVLLNFLCLIYAACNLRHRKFHRFLNNFEREHREVSSIGIGEQIANTSPKLSYKNNPSDRYNGVGGDRLCELTASTPDDLDGPVARADKSNWTFWNALITLRYFRDTYAAATKPRDSRAIILLLLLAGFLSALSLAALMSLLFVYVKMDPFNWTTGQYSAWNSISSISRGTALIALTLGMKFYSNWAIPDQFVATLGFLSKGAGLLLIGLANESATLYWALASFTLSEYAMPPIRSLLSKLVVNEELCKIYACLGSLQNAGFVVGNAALYVVYNYSITHQDYFRLSFIVTAALEFGAAIIMLMIHTSLRRRVLVS